VCPASGRPIIGGKVCELSHGQPRVTQQVKDRATHDRRVAIRGAVARRHARGVETQGTADMGASQLRVRFLQFLQNADMPMSA
jgi:hypothetical protein